MFSGRMSNNASKKRNIPPFTYVTPLQRGCFGLKPQTHIRTQVLSPSSIRLQLAAMRLYWRLELRAGLEVDQEEECVELLFTKAE